MSATGAGAPVAGRCAVSVIRRAPRPWAMKLKAQRVRTTSRFSNPIRYQRCTVSQVIHARKPPTRMCLMSATARASDRGEVALVAVAKASSGAAAETVADDASSVAALLHRDGREPGKHD